MQEDDLVIKTRKRKKYNSYQGEIASSVPNLIQRDFHANKPNEKRLTDITEFAIPTGKIYLSSIVVCFDGMLPCWTIGIAPDNAACEGLFGRLKNEMFYHRDWIGVSIQKFIYNLNDYLIWYNQKRIKQSLGNMSPGEYRQNLGLTA